MLVFGCDPGSSRCGYGVVRVDGPRFAYVAAGVIEVPAKRTLAARLVEIGRELEEVVGEVLAGRAPGERVAAGIEAGYIDDHGRTVLVLGAARGVALYILGRLLDCEVREYQPATVKKAACGSGHAPKEQVARMVGLRLGLRRQLAPDAADAVAVALCRAQDGRKEPT